jgi:glycosyltransferase involved in cell wall biosynthesis
VIALRAGSVPEVVREGVSGFVCDTVDQMAERVNNLTTTPSAIRKYMKDNFSVEVMVAKYIKLYRSIYSALKGLPVPAADQIPAESGAIA